MSTRMSCSSVHSTHKFCHESESVSYRSVHSTHKFCQENESVSHTLCHKYICYNYDVTMISNPVSQAQRYTIDMVIYQQYITLDKHQHMPKNV